MTRRRTTPGSAATGVPAEPSATAPPGGAEPREARNLSSLGALMLAHLLSDGTGNYLPGVLPAVLVAFGLPTSMAGAMIAALSIGQVLQPVVGWIADKVGGRALPPLGLLLSSLGGGLIPLAPGLGVLIVLLLAIGVGSSLFHPPSLASIRRMPSSHTGLYISVFLVGGELGRGVWPTVASLITVELGLPWLWLIAVPGVVWAPVLFHWMPRLPATPSDQRRRIRWRAHAGPATLLIVFRGLQAFTVLGLSAWISVLWRVRGETLVAGASVITAIITIGVVGNLLGGFLADRIGRRPVLLLSASAAFVLVLSVGRVPGWWVYPVAGVLGMALFLPSAAAILIGQDIFPENRSMGSGVALGFANGLAAVGVLLVGLLVTDATVHLVFYLFAALSAVAIVVALMFPARLMRSEA